MFAACGGSTTTAVNTNVGANRPGAVTNAPATTTSQNNSLVVSSHSTDQNSSVKANQSSMEQQNSPMAKPIDVTEMTAKIEKADKDFKAKPDDDKLKKALADAYFERAFALTKAAQYRPALGDFRKGLKLNPEDKEAQSMHDQIIEIFKSIGREPPKEGEEPAPLPFKKS
jgi:tetratricopeptide (TPR) repeat protein